MVEEPDEDQNEVEGDEMAEEVASVEEITNEPDVEEQESAVQEEEKEDIEDETTKTETEVTEDGDNSQDVIDEQVEVAQPEVVDTVEGDVKQETNRDIEEEKMASEGGEKQDDGQGMNDCWSTACSLCCQTEFVDTCTCFFVILSVHLFVCYYAVEHCSE